MEERDEFYYPLLDSSPSRTPRAVIKVVNKIQVEIPIDPTQYVGSEEKIWAEEIWGELQRRLGMLVVKYFSENIPPLALKKHHFITIDRNIEKDKIPGYRKFVYRATIWQIIFDSEKRVRLDEENYIMHKALETIADSDAYPVPTYEISKAGELLETGSFDCPQCEEKIKIAKSVLQDVEGLRNENR